MTTATHPEQTNAAGFPRVCWDAITEPGSYVDVATGDLYRVPEEAVARGAAPIIRRQSHGPSWLVRIDENPFIPTADARMLAAMCDVAPNF